MTFTASCEDYGVELTTTLRLNGIAALKEVRVREDEYEEIAEVVIDELWTATIHLYNDPECFIEDSSKNFLGVYLDYTGEKKVAQESSGLCTVHFALKSLCHEPMPSDTFKWGWENLQESGGTGIDELIALDELLDDPSVKADDAVLLTIRVVPPSLLYGEAPDVHIEKSIRQTVLNDFEEVFRDADIAFRLYRCAPPTKREGDVDTPLIACTETIFSKRKVLEGLCLYFKGDEQFAKGAPHFGKEKMPLFSESYDYLSDSDLEDASDYLKHKAQLSSSEVSCVGRRVEMSSSGSDNSVELMEVAEELTEPVDSSGSNSDQHCFRPSLNTTSATDISLKASLEEKAIPVGDVAYKTWRSMLYYLHLKVIAFTPLKSDPVYSYTICETDYIENNPGMKGPCSCKSMYRLADKLGIKELEDLSFRFLKSQLNHRVIFKEIFSSFTSRYSKIQDLEFGYLMQHWDELKSSDELRDKLRPTTAGEFPQSQWLLERLIGNVAAPAIGTA